MSREEIIAGAMAIPTMMSEADFNVLYDKAMKYITEGGCAIEIGAWKGSSAYVIGSVCKEKNAVLYEIDTYAGDQNKDSERNRPESMNSYDEAVKNPDFFWVVKNNLKGLPVAILKGDSREIMNYLPDKMFDLCFIDGNHDKEVVAVDMKNALKKVKVGGLVCGHDHGNTWYNADVQGAVEEVLGTDWVCDGVATINGTEYLTTIWSHIV